MSEDPIQIDVHKITREVGLNAKEPWRGHKFHHAQEFLSKIDEMLRANPDATEVHIYGLIPVEIAFGMAWMMGQAGLKIMYARPHCYLMDLPIPYGAYYESEELGFV